MYQKIILIGNLGADPDVRYTATGKAVAELRVATTYGFGEKQETEWHRVVAWEKAAEAAGKYLHKGSKVMVEGRIKQRSYDDKDGNKRYITEIIASEVKFLDPKAKGDGGGEDRGESDLPF